MFLFYSTFGVNSVMIGLISMKVTGQVQLRLSVYRRDCESRAFGVSCLPSCEIDKSV